MDEAGARLSTGAAHGVPGIPAPPARPPHARRPASDERIIIFNDGQYR